jgi:hypothetical protein
VAENKPAGKKERVLNREQILSLERAIDDEIDISGQSKTVVLHIDAIELVHMGQGGFIYRLFLSNPGHFQADQPLTLRAGRAYDSECIQASVLSTTDQEIYVLCRRALPDDVRLLHAEFDPGFVFAALRQFILRKNESPAGLAHQLARRSIPPAHKSAQTGPVAGFNDQQLAGLRRMLTGPMHFLWGPPGTGKTRTVGAAIAEWLRREKSVLIVSTSNVAVDIALKAAIQHMSEHEAQAFLRLGNTDDPELSDFTVAGTVAKDPRIAPRGSNHIQRVQQRLREVGEKLTQLLLHCRQRNRTSDL